MAIKITVDGKTYNGIDAITVGGKVLTLAYVEDSTGGDTGGNTGGTTTKTYTITNNLTNCTNSSSKTTITEKTAYTAVITADSGYALESVTVTMGGSAVGASNGVINIPSVTGNIVITATAVEASTGGGDSGGTGGDETENNGWVDGQPYAIEWTDGYVLDIGTGDVIEATDMTMSGFIPCCGVSAVEANSSVYGNYFYAYDADKNYLGRINKVNSTPISINKEIHFIRCSARLNQKATASVTPRAFEELTDNTSWISDKHYTLPLKNEGMSINKDTGAEGSDSMYVASDYAFCFGASSIDVEGHLAKTSWRKTVVFYDADKNYISGTIGNDSPYTVPENAMYFRVSSINGFEFTIQKPNKPWVKLS